MGNGRTSKGILDFFSPEELIEVLQQHLGGAVVQTKGLGHKPPAGRYTAVCRPSLLRPFPVHSSQAPLD